jgi:hypothetical protein
MFAGEIKFDFPRKLGPTKISKKLERKAFLEEAWRGR